jgi:signal transduction histidine kinase
MSLRALLLAALSYVLLLTVIAFAIPLAHTLDQRVEREVRVQARTSTKLLSVAATDILPPAEEAGTQESQKFLQRLVDESAELTRGRVIVVDRHGILIADSATPEATGDSYASRPEVAAALAGASEQTQRSSDTLGRPVLVTAEPVRIDGKVAGVVRVSQDVGAISHAVWRGRLALLGLVVLVLALGFAVAAVLARLLAKPLASLEEAAHRVAAGDMTAVAPVTGSREQQAVAEAFNTMTARVDRTLTAQQQFVANASHQLRTPLTGVRLRIEEARVDASPESAEHLDAATAEVDRLSETIDDLLVLSRTEERAQAIRPVALEQLATAAAQRVEATAMREGRAVRVTLQEPAVVLADRADFDRVLDALLENALVYGAGPIDVTVRGPRVDVSDRGPGLGPGEADGRLLERFRRGRAGRTQPGTGLGLAIAATLAARSGAVVGIEPREGGGATAYLDAAGSVD